MQVFGNQISLEEIEQIAGWISDKMNKNTNALCLLLYFCNKFINDWYNEINKMFVPVIRKGGFRNVEEAKLDEIYTFMGQSRYEPLANTLYNRLSDIITGWNETGQLSRIINTREEIQKLDNFRQSLKLFVDFAAEKREWFDNVTKPESLKDVDIECVKEWKSKLRVNSVDVNGWKDNLGKKWHCREADMRRLVEEYYESIRKST